MRKCLKKIFDENFMELFNVNKLYEEDDIKMFVNNYNLNYEIDALFFHLLYLNVIIYTYLYYPNQMKKERAEVLEFFFEEKTIKEQQIEYMKERIEKKNINKNNVKFPIEDYNYIYYSENNKNNFIFNIYDYRMENINIDSPYDDLKKQFENENNYSLYKNFKDNSLFSNADISNEYNNNISKMLSSEVINEAFYNFSAYKGFENPFRSKQAKEIIEQINKIKYYINFPLFKIDGLTFKGLGIILINKKMKKIEEVCDDMKLIKYIINISFKKSTECHEIVSHYISIMLRANSHEYKLITPNNTFINYSSDDISYNSNYDGGDKLESLLFGNKIIYLTYESSIFILSENSLNFDDIENFRSKFIENNKIKEIKIDLNKIDNNIPIIKVIIKNIGINNEQKYIYISLSDSFILFRKGVMNFGCDNYMIDDNILDSERLSLNCNLFLCKRESINKIIEIYGK